jgi:putative oxidoreductase
MSAQGMTGESSRLRGLQATGTGWAPVVARAVGGLTLLMIGLAHIAFEDARMFPLVEAAGFPAPELLAPLAVAAEVVAGVLLLAGAFARLAAIIAIPTMVGAFYSHLAIDVWPNGPENEPPLLLPVVVAVAAAFVLWRGAGRWSVDRRMSR